MRNEENLSPNQIIQNLVVINITEKCDCVCAIRGKMNDIFFESTTSLFMELILEIFSRLIILNISDQKKSIFMAGGLNEKIKR